MREYCFPIFLHSTVVYNINIWHFALTIWPHSVSSLSEKHFGVFSNVSDVGTVSNDDFFHDELHSQIFFWNNLQTWLYLLARLIFPCFVTLLDNAKQCMNADITKKNSNYISLTKSFKTTKLLIKSETQSGIYPAIYQFIQLKIDLFYFIIPCIIWT